MIRSIYLVLVYLSFLGMGFGAPFVFTLGYVWVDLFTPQSVAYIILNQIPCAMIMGAAAVGAYVAMDRRFPPRFSSTTTLTILLGVWCTVTLLWAEVPNEAWQKWDWAFKTVMFSALIPYVIRSRAQIEAFLLVYVCSIAGNVIPFGLKTAISGGGYGRNLGLVGGNSGMSEGAFFATAAVSILPILLYILNHSILLPRQLWAKVAVLGMMACTIVAAVGTYERTGLLGLGVFGVTVFVKSKRKLLIGCIGVVAALGLFYQTSSGWNQRMATLQDYSADSSALTRILVWKWTFQYSLTHPLGGGFESYMVDRIDYPDGSTVFGRAFHSLYFELLGEQGWVGLGLYLSIVVVTFLRLRRVAQETKSLPDLAWCTELANMLQVMLLTMMVCGAFIGVAYRGLYYYCFGVAVSLSEYVWRVLKDSRVPVAPPVYHPPVPLQAPADWRGRLQRPTR